MIEPEGVPWKKLKKGADLASVRKAVLDKGLTTLETAARRLVEQGETSLAELKRAIGR